MLAASLAAGSLSAGSLSANPADTPKPLYYEMRYFKMRTDRTEQGRRTNAFLSSAYLPAAKKAGAGLIGLFGASIAPDSPFTLVLTSYPSLEAFGSVREKLAASEDYQKALAEYNGGPDQGFVTMESTLLRGFDTFPGIEQPPPGEPRRPARMFELRTYQALNESYEQKKIKMFGAGGEIGIFKRLGLSPTWFGQAIAGVNLPHISYMVAFENLAAREKLWAAFGSDSEWQKLRSSPEFGVPGLSSNISNSILNPLGASEIR